MISGVSTASMGNEASSYHQASLLAECSVDETPIVTAAHWTLHHAQRRDAAADPAQLSVYVAREGGHGHKGGPSHLDLLEKVRSSGGAIYRYSLYGAL